MLEPPVIDYETTKPKQRPNLLLRGIRLLLLVVTVLSFWFAYDLIFNGPGGSGGAMVRAVHLAEISLAIGLVSLAGLLLSLPGSTPRKRN